MGAARRRGMGTSCRDAIKLFESHMERNKKGEKADESKYVKLYGMFPPITKIDPAALSTLKACEQLSLSSNNIDKVGNLAGMESLKILSLGRNLIKKLDNMDGLGNKLEQLWVSYNQLSSLAGVEKLKCLKVLYVGNNKIADLKEINRLVEIPDLEELVLYGNPFHWNVVAKDGELAYASQVMEILPGLKKLDGISCIEWKQRMDSGNEKQLREVVMKIDPVEIEVILFKILKTGAEEISFEDFCYWFK